MKSGSHPKKNLYVTMLVGIALLVAMPLSTAGAAPVKDRASGVTLVVNSTLDAPDADPSNGICASLAGACTLRAAIMEANFTPAADIISLPAGIYKLTRPGVDDAALVGDLDITAQLSIQGAGASSTIVDGNSAVTADRVFDVLDSARVVNMSGLTVRNGKVSTASHGFFGGGIQVFNVSTASDLTLNLTNVVLMGNSANSGGGLYSESAIVTLDNTTVHDNSAILGGTGGGIYSNAGSALSILNSHIYANSANGGGGLELVGLEGVQIVGTEIDSNTAAAASGGGISVTSGRGSALSLVNSNLHDNTAALDGGAISADLSTLILDHSVLNANHAGQNGGAVYATQGATSNNFVFRSSTLSRNTALSGGAIYYKSDTSPTPMTLVNSTISGNIVSADGAGIDAIGSSGIGLYNVTIASNVLSRVHGTSNPMRGGGVFLADTAVIAAKNTLIANNIYTNNLNQVLPDDCYNAGTTLNSLGYNLIETTTNCAISGTTTGNITGQDPLLGPLAANGGPNQTHKLLAGSPAIDAGQQPACADADGLSLASDQRGLHRITGPACDIGAYEAPIRVTLQSAGLRDGWMLESTENSGAGKSLNSTGTTFRLGDDAANRQFRGILQFNTAVLPDTAMITTAVLKIMRQGLVGTNPFGTHGRLLVDVNKPFFGGTSALQPADFQAVSRAAAVGSFGTTPVNSWYSATLTSAGRQNINRVGTTQFRLRFTLDDNNDRSADYMSFYSGDFATAADWPTLAIEYYMP